MEKTAVVARQPRFSIEAAVGVAVLVFPLGCSVPQQGRLEARSGGPSGSLEVDDPVRAEGPLRGELPSGDRCSGTFQQVNVADLEALGAPPPPIRSSDTATLASLTCDRGGALRCTLARTTGGVFSFGECKDADGNEYKLRF